MAEQGRALYSVATATTLKVKGDQNSIGLRKNLGYAGKGVFCLFV